MRGHYFSTEQDFLLWTQNDKLKKKKKVVNVTNGLLNEFQD